MDNSTKSIKTVNISDIQDEYTAQNVIALNKKFPQRPDDYAEYNYMQLTIRKKSDDIMSLCQTLNYVLVRSTNLEVRHMQLFDE
eukprot:1274514-Amphidinium_carterae.1